MLGQTLREFQRASEIKTDARTKAERVESEARVNAEQVMGEARSRAAAVDQQADDRRRELFSALEREQGELTVKVDALRGFESSYRQNLGGTLQHLLSSLNDARPEPADVPELAQRNPANLHARLLEVNAARKLVRQLPSERQVADWVPQAAALPRMLTY